MAEVVSKMYKLYWNVEVRGNRTTSSNWNKLACSHSWSAWKKGSTSTSQLCQMDPLCVVDVDRLYGGVDFCYDVDHHWATRGDGEFKTMSLGER